MWIVELEKGVFIYYGRVTTLRQMFAKRFKTEAAAKAALTIIRNFLQKEFKNANIYQVEQ